MAYGAHTAVSANSDIDLLLITERAEDLVCKASINYLHKQLYGPVYLKPYAFPRLETNVNSACM